MPKFTMVIPGAETPEGQARINKEVEDRNRIDFKAFRILRDLRDQRVINVATLAEVFAEDWLEGDDWDPKEHAIELVEEIDQLIRDRRMADHYVLQALAGRPDPRGDIRVGG